MMASIASPRPCARAVQARDCVRAPKPRDGSQPAASKSTAASCAIPNSRSCAAASASSSTVATLDAAPRLYLMLNKPRGLVTTHAGRTRPRHGLPLLRRRRAAVAGAGRPARQGQRRPAAVQQRPGVGGAHHRSRHRPGQDLSRAGRHAAGRRRCWRRWSPASTSKANACAPVRRACCARARRNAWLEIVLDEGRNRQIRRLLAAFDIGVLRLVRVAIGPLRWATWARGSGGELSADEVAALVATAMSSLCRAPARCDVRDARRRASRACSAQRSSRRDCCAMQRRCCTSVMRGKRASVSMMARRWCAAVRLQARGVAGKKPSPPPRPAPKAERPRNGGPHPAVPAEDPVRQHAVPLQHAPERQEDDRRRVRCLDEGARHPRRQGRTGRWRSWRGRATKQRPK